MAASFPFIRTIIFVCLCDFLFPFVSLTLKSGKTDTRRLVRETWNGRDGWEKRTEYENARKWKQWHRWKDRLCVCVCVCGVCWQWNKNEMGSSHWPVNKKSNPIFPAVCLVAPPCVFMRDCLPDAATMRRSPNHRPVFKYRSWGWFFFSPFSFCIIRLCRDMRFHTPVTCWYKAAGAADQRRHKSSVRRTEIQRDCEDRSDSSVSVKELNDVLTEGPGIQTLAAANEE